MASEHPLLPYTLVYGLCGGGYCDCFVLVCLYCGEISFMSTKLTSAACG